MWLGGDQMHRAVADLFLDDNPALLRERPSRGLRPRPTTPARRPRRTFARRRPGDRRRRDTWLPTRRVGSTVELQTGRRADARRRLIHRPACTSWTRSRMASRSTTCRRRPTRGTSSAPWIAALAEVRGGDFHGAQLLFGLHSDAMVGGNPLVAVRRLPAHRLLAAEQCRGLADPRRGLDQRHVQRHDGLEQVLRPPGSTIKIPTRFGPAIGLVQPTPGPITSLAREVTAAFFGLLAHINFATDVDEESTTCAASQRLRPRPALRRSRRDQPVKLHNDTALSLDGKAPTGHSVGQHV